jgi:hypothetical protein
MTSALGLIFALLVLALLVWAGDGLLKLWPSQGKLMQAIRIIAIVALALLVLSWIATYFGVALPWNFPRHR